MITLLSAWGARAPELKKNPNIGDRFIEDAVVELLRTTAELAEEQFPVLPARLPLKRAALATVNRSRALILCGSNLLHRTFWPEYVKLTNRLSRIRVPIVSLGCGWGGERPLDKYRFRDSSRVALRHIAESFPIFSVRDVITRDLLEEQVPETRGRISVTGCPVLFHHNRGQFDCEKLGGGGGEFSPRRILFSSNERLLLDEHVLLYRRVRELFPDASITLALNQASDLFTSRIQGEPIEIVHSDNPDDYYALFDRHDFQIGFRLHNHMSFLSLSKPTLTVGADGRTGGFAKTFDLMDISPAEIPGLTRERIRDLLHRNANRLSVTAPPRWGAMKELIHAIADLPGPAPRSWLARRLFP